MYYDDPKWTGPRCSQCNAPVKEVELQDTAKRIHAKVGGSIRYWCSGCYC